jgi:hypothetical protein
MGPRDGMWREREIREQRAHFAGRGEGLLHIAASQGQRAEQAHVQRRNGASPFRPIPLRGSSHAGTHAGLHEWLLQCVPSSGA